jgi:hypothetical protein
MLQKSASIVKKISLALLKFQRKISSHDRRANLKRRKLCCIHLRLFWQAVYSPAGEDGYPKPITVIAPSIAGTAITSGRMRLKDFPISICWT